MVFDAEAFRASLVDPPRVAATLSSSSSSMTLSPEEIFFRALRHAEFMLLVDDDQTHLRQIKTGSKQGVGANEQ